MTEDDEKNPAVAKDENQLKADQKIEAQDKLMRSGHPTERQRQDDQQILNEMRVNKASVDFNRAMQDYDDENPEAKRSTSSDDGVSSPGKDGDKKL